MTIRVVVIGGGWAGAAAAIAASKIGAEVELCERTDMLLGTGLVGGIMRNNGRWTATEEAIAMGGGDLFKLTDQISRHRDIDLPGHKHASLYDVAKAEPSVRRLLEEYDVKMHFCNRGKNVEMTKGRITKLKLDDGILEADVFVEATGSAGGMANCAKYGNGCVMCVYRCPTFGSRISIAGKAGVQERMGSKADGTIGAMSGSCKLLKESLAQDIIDKLDSAGVAIIPIPPQLQKGEGALATKACQQYALKEFAQNIILLDTGHAKLMSPFYPLEILRKIPGFEDARYEDPYAGGVGNSMRYLALSPRENTMQVKGVENLFCGGEKAGLLVGHTEAIITGTLAGHNAVRYAQGKELVKVPRELAIGEAIAWVKEQMETGDGMKKKYTFSGAVLLKHLEGKELYTTDKREIVNRVGKAGMENIFALPLI